MAPLPPASHSPPEQAPQTHSPGPIPMIQQPCTGTSRNRRLRTRTTQTPHHIPCTGSLRYLRLRTRTHPAKSPAYTAQQPLPPSKPPRPPLNCALLNTWSLPKHSTEIHDLIISRNLDILALTETWLHPAAGPSLSLAVPPNYNIIREDRAKGKGGGVAIIYKDSIPLRSIDATPFPNCEALTAKLSTDASTTITFLLLYRPPNDNSKFEDILIQTVAPTLKPLSKFIILGDLNLGLNDPRDLEASSLAAALTNLGFSHQVSAPTHKHGRTLDWITSVNVNTQPSILPCPWSDHATILFTIPTPQAATPPPPPPAPIWCRNKKKITATNLSPILTSSYQNSTLPNTPDEIADLYHATLTHALDTLAPLKLITPRHHKKSKPWFTPALHDLLAKKRNLEANWLKNPTPANRLAYSDTAKTYKQAITTAKAHSLNTRIASAKNDMKELFLILRELETPIAPPDSTLKNDAWCTSIQTALNNKTSLLHDKILSKRNTLQPRASPTTTPAPSPPTLPPAFSFRPLTEPEVFNIIKGLKPSSCKGDICPAHIIKDCANPLIPVITKFINASFASSSVPTSVKEAWITPLLKKPTLDPNVPTNYRPITTVPFLLKILDRAAYLQIQQHLEQHKLLGTRQSGFRPGHGTETALLDLKIQLDRTRDKGDLAALLLLDLSAAFDLVDHPTLCRQLSSTANFSPQASTWIASFLSDRTSRVFSGPNAAPASPVTCGVPQGSCVSPTLYNIYTKPLFDSLDALGVTYTNFADDTQVLVPLTGHHTNDSATLNNIYDIIQAWMADNHLCLNDDKTELLIVGPASKLRKLPPDFSTFTIAGNSIPVSKSVKTLGVYLDADLSMTRQVNATISAASYHLKLLNQAKPFLTEGNRATIARAVIGTKIDYCNVLLAGASQQNINRLQVLQNNVVRSIKNLGRRDHVSEARRDLHWLPIRSRIEFKTLSIAHRCLSNSAPAYLLPTIQRKTYTRTLRSSNDNSLLVPRFHSKKAGGSSFYVIAPTLWNALPAHLKEEHSYWRFRRALKTHLFQ